MLAKGWQRGKQAVALALRPWRPHVAIGAIIFASLSAGALAYATSHSRPLGPEVVTWCEWFVAVDILPALILPGLARRAEIQAWVRRRMGMAEEAESEATYEYRLQQRNALLRFCALLWIWGGTVFGLDLLLRALTGLGFDPF